MKDKLDTLIDCYEAEKNRLLQLIDACVKEEEYQLAYFHQRALYQLNRRLQTLKNINDKFYDEKSFIWNRISFLEKNIKPENPDALNDYFFNELDEAKEELEKLIQRSNKVDSAEDKLIINEAMSDLLEKKIKNFKLILIRKDNLFLEFKYIGKTLCVTIPLVKKHIKNGVLYEWRINKLKRLGFESQKKDSKLVLKLKADKEKLLENLKIILCKIIFEVFYFKEFENESYIEINS